MALREIQENRPQSDILEEDNAGPTESTSLKLDLQGIEDTAEKNIIKRKQKQKSSTGSKKLNPYENTDIAAIKLLRKRNRLSKKKVTLKPLHGQEGGGDAQTAASPVGDGPLDVTNRTEEVDGGRGDMTGRTGSTLPPVMCRQRYKSASLRSVYMREDERNRRSKGSAGTRKSNSLVWEVGGGSLMTYTGVQRFTKETLEESTKRLAIADVEKVPNANRVVPKDVTKKCGLTASFQWTAGGQRCHGFIW